MNRPVRTRMRGGVGAGGEKPPATRLGNGVVRATVSSPTAKVLVSVTCRLPLYRPNLVQCEPPENP